MDIDFSKINLLIGEATTAVANKKREFVQPSRFFMYFDILVPPDFTQTLEFEHWYNFVPDQNIVSRRHHIIHGHDKFIACAAPHYCHLMNYKPGSEHNPSFRLMFEKKWSILYERR